MISKRFLNCLALFLLVTVIFFIRLFMLQKSPHPNGLDGYFYALQAKSLAETGSLENPSHELGYYLCGVGAWITNNPILGVKIWSALSSALVSLAAFMLVFNLTKKKSLSFLAFLLTSASPTFSLMGINFINNQTGIMFLLLYAAQLVRIRNSPFRSVSNQFNKAAFAFLLFVFSALSHKVSMIYGIFLTLLFMLSFFRFSEWIGRRKSIFLILGLSSLFVGFLLFLFFRRQSPRFFNAFSLPFVGMKNPGQLLNYIGFLGVSEICFYMVLLYGLILARRNFLQAVLVLSLYFPCWNLAQDMGCRLLINAVPLGIPLFLWILGDFFKGRAVSLWAKKLLYLLCGLLSLCAFFTPNLYEPKKDPPYAYYKKLIQDIELEDDSLLIAHLGLNHVYTYYKGLKDALNWLPDFYVSVEKTWRIAYGADEERILSFFRGEKKHGLVRQLDSRYVLIREDLWQAYLLREEPEISDSMKNWFNPSQVRPAYIRRNNN